ncbi:MAG: hypothetical protein WCK90_00605 [archaeon]
METREITHIGVAIIVMTLVFGFAGILENGFTTYLPSLLWILLFSALIILVAIAAKKVMARALDSDVEHEIWSWSRYGFKPNEHLKTPLPAGALFPLALALVTIGYFKLCAFLTYETRVSKYRASKRFGIYSFSEMTDWHNGLIGAVGIMSVLLVGVIGYFQGAELLFKMATYYAVFNLIPFSKLDGAQIFFGNRILWATLAIITLIATAYAFAISGSLI